MNGRICIPYTESIRSVYGPYHSTWGVMIIQMRWSFWFNVWNVHWFGENLTFLLIFFFLFRNTENKSDKEIHERNRWYGFRWWRITLGWSIVFYHRESDRKQIQSIHSRIIKENKDFFPWRLYWSTRRSTQSIIYASKKYMVDQNFTDNLLNLDRLKIKADYFYGSHLLFYSRCQWFKSHQNSIRSPGRNIRYCTVVFVPYF